MVACAGHARVTGGRTKVDGQWLTYQELAVRLGVTPEAARRRAIRGKWARMPGNDGRTRVRAPDDWRPQGAPGVRPDASALVTALESHIKTLQGDNETLRQHFAAAAARADKLEADFAARDAQHTAELKAERAQTEKAIAAFASLADRLDALANQRRPWWQRLVG